MDAVAAAEPTPQELEAAAAAALVLPYGLTFDHEACQRDAGTAYWGCTFGIGINRDLSRQTVMLRTVLLPSLIF